MAIFTKVEPWQGLFGTTTAEKTVALRKFGSDLELIESLAGDILTRFHASGYWGWVKGNGTVSRYVIVATLDENLKLRYFKARASNHATISDDFDLSINISGPEAWAKADLQLEVLSNSWRVLSGGEIEYLKIPPMDQDNSFYIPGAEVEEELVVTDACWREALNQVLVAAQEAIGLGRINSLTLDQLEKTFSPRQRVEGIIITEADAGFVVDLLNGTYAFLPRSQLDVYPVRDAGPLMGPNLEFQVVKLDRRRGNIVVSRRAILEERFLG